MNLKDAIGLVWGVFMGTSVRFLKTTRDFSFPTKKENLSAFELLIGGKRNQLIGKNISVDPADPSTESVIFTNRSNPLDPKSVEGLVIRGVGPKHTVVWLPNEKTLVLGDLFYNRVHPPIKELQLPGVKLLREILEELSKEFQPKFFLPAEGALSNSYEDFLVYLADLGDKNQEFATLRDKYSHFQEIVGLSSFSENFDYLRR